MKKLKKPALPRPKMAPPFPKLPKKKGRGQAPRGGGLMSGLMKM